jgi:catechol 2,3-dioxygenase-like lactoylglutathione lyase family enzyme
MAGTIGNEQDVHGWKYTRPVLFVADVNRSIQFYVDVLGFEKKWHEGDGKGTVCQVNRGDTEVILCQDAARRDKGRLFVELNKDELAHLRSEIDARSIPWEKSWWGYDVIKILDPDGNEWLLAYD